MTNSFARASFQAPAASGDSKAYAAIWIVLFAMILFGWRRQRKIDARITGLEASLAQARAAQPAKKAEAS